MGGEQYSPSRGGSREWKGRSYNPACHCIVAGPTCYRLTLWALLNNLILDFTMYQSKRWVGAERRTEGLFPGKQEICDSCECPAGQGLDAPGRRSRLEGAYR